MPGNPFRTVWFYNSISGSVISEPALGDTIQAHLPGWHGPFGTKQEALDFYAQNRAAHPDWKAPTGFLGAVGNTVAKAAGAGWSLLWPGAGHFMLRLAEGVVGIAFLIIGLNALLKQSTGVSAGSVVKAVRP